MSFEYLLDADSFNFLRKLGVLELIRSLAAFGKVKLHLTGYVASFELNSLQDDVNALAREKAIEVHKLRPGTDAFKAFKDLFERRRRFKRSIDKGECEEIGWLSTEGKGIALVSCDGGARELAEANRIRALNICDLMCELVSGGLIAKDVATTSLAPWADPHVGLGRPKDYPGFEKALEQWIGRR